MNNDVTPSIALVDRSILKSHVEVRETVATGMELNKQSRRSFGLVDLWSIRRNAKVASTLVRRF